MGSSIALLVFGGFIIACFVVEAKGRETVTAAVWLPLFWMVICASRSVDQWLNLGNAYRFDEAAFQQANLNGSPVDRVVLTAAILLAVVIIFNRKGAAGKILRDNKALLVFVVYLGLTALWSDVIAISLRRWTRLFGHLVMAGVIVSEPDAAAAVKSVFRRFAYLVAPLSVMLIKYFPQSGVLHWRKGELIWIGVAVMKNGLGHLSLVVSLFLVWAAISAWGSKTKPGWLMGSCDLIVLTMALWLLRGPGEASSSAAIGAMIAGVVILVGSRLPSVKKNFDKTGRVLVLATCLFVALNSTFGIVESIVTGLGRNMTFTDRVPLWNILVDVGLDRPLFGYGYGGFWTVDREASIETRAGGFNQGHNGYLEIFVEGGIVAIILLGVLLVSVFRTFQRTKPSGYEYAVLRLSLFAAILLANITESAFARERDLLTFVFFIIAMNSEPSASECGAVTRPVQAAKTWMRLGRIAPQGAYVEQRY